MALIHQDCNSTEATERDAFRKSAWQQPQLRRFAALNAESGEGVNDDGPSSSNS